MILSAVFSKPAAGKYTKVRLFRMPDTSAKGTAFYSAEFFTKTQVFQKKFSEAEAENFYRENAGTAFKNVICITPEEEITTLTNRHGEIKKLTKKRNAEFKIKNALTDRKKNYILKEDEPVPFLVHLGIMTKEGKIISSKHDKFRQINRFLEFLDDIIDDLKLLCTDGKDFTEERPLSVLDFGSGKSYLTFAVHHYLTKIKHIPVSITGIDLKKDVIDDCQKFAASCGFKDISFICGNVADFKNHSCDLMITLHACDTATDYALAYAINKNTTAVLSVPCCQHEINAQLKKNADAGAASVFLHHGILGQEWYRLVQYGHQDRAKSY